MSYNASGDFTVRATPESLIELGLRMTGDLSEEDLLVDGFDGNDPVASLLGANGYEVTSSRQESDGTIVVTGFRESTSWYDGDSESVLRFLAKSGMDVSAQFVGEDDGGWAYHTVDGVLREESFNRHTGSEIVAFSVVANAVLNLQKRLAQNPTMSVDELRAAVEALPTEAVVPYLAGYVTGD